MASQKVPAFKVYAQNQLQLLPPSLEELIPNSHPCRVVNKIIDGIDISSVLNSYEGGGCPSYNPRMLLKVVIYGYMTNLYSSRKIETAIKENIAFMWLAGMNQPDHNTISRFRGERLREVLKPIFTQIVLLLSEAGLVDIHEVFVDGTKIEANANRYSFVWGNALKTNKERIGRQLEELWNYAHTMAETELKDTSPINYREITPEKVAETIAKIDAATKGKPTGSKFRQKLNYGRKNWPDKLKQYENQQQILQQRNSYSKTDPDATFMRMKDDHMENGQLKPGYNLQISTNNQIITNYSLHPNPTDTTTLIPHLEEYKRQYGKAPDVVVADAGYGSEENYEYLKANETEGFVKYNTFQQDQQPTDKIKGFPVTNLFYNEEQNCYYCPIGQTMRYIGHTSKTSENGYVQHYAQYQAANCSGCPLRGVCHKGKGNRIISVNHRLLELKNRAVSLLTSQKGIAYRKKRSVDVESVFGNIKYNHKFDRFLLRGNLKVEIEIGLLAIAQNLRKMVA